MINLKTGIDSYDQQIGKLALIDNIITHWNINQDRGYGNDDFTALLNEFKFNLEKHITFLESLNEAA